MGVFCTTTFQTSTWLLMHLVKERSCIMITFINIICFFIVYSIVWCCIQYCKTANSKSVLIFFFHFRWYLEICKRWGPYYVKLLLLLLSKMYLALGNIFISTILQQDCLGAWCCAIIRKQFSTRDYTILLSQHSCQSSPHLKHIHIQFYY